MRFLLYPCPGGFKGFVREDLPWISQNKAWALPYCPTLSQTNNMQLRFRHPSRNLEFLSALITKWLWMANIINHPLFKTVTTGKLLKAKPGAMLGNLILSRTPSGPIPPALPIGQRWIYAAERTLPKVKCYLLHCQKLYRTPFPSLKSIRIGHLNAFGIICL